MSSSPPSAGDARRARLDRFLDGLRTIFINALFTALVVVVGYSLLVTYRMKEEETAQKRLAVQQARRELLADTAINKELEREIHFLRTPAGVEKVARERLGLVRPYETTYVVVNAPPAATRHRSSSPRDEAPPTSKSTLSWAWDQVVLLWNGGD